MNLLLETMQRHFPKLNHQAYTWDDVERVAAKHRINITVTQYPENILGYYCAKRTEKRVKKHIVINSILGPIDRTFTGLHELAHYFLHVPVSSRQYFFCKKNAKQIMSKHDCEANAFALIAMIPLWQLIDAEGSSYQDLQPGAIAFLKKRKKLWEGWGV
jgi:Zn-dependent peptidase ImmA (M78 family)